ncbi:MAG: GSCFA domain-containing protein [Bacteroidetes bacterium]|nr:GSCFA domain-containing protein [Bacteroidota bacterium]
MSDTEQEQCLRMINRSQRNAIARVKNLDWLIITTGSAFIYNLKETGTFVGNCHKAPNKIFDKKLLSVSQITDAFENVISKLLELTPNLKVLFTVSPVRYTRDGVVENNLSKAILLQATHQLVEQNKQASYFPAYELVIDDLRDYRFFKEDLVHPNQQAIEYVWGKFESACIDSDSLKILEQLKQIIKAKEHRPLHPESIEHQAFRKQNFEQARQLMEKYPYLDLKEEESFFKS